MNDKFSWTDLRHALAKRTGVSEKEAGAFLQALVEQIIEGLKADQSVRINGLGTFRLQAVAPRKSVNVTTGEAMTIAGYNKLSFAAESSTKELIQSAGHVAEEATPLQKLSDQADEIEGILGEINAIQEPKVESQEPKEETPIISDENPTKSDNSDETPIKSEDPTPEPKPEPEPKPKKKYHPLRDGLITIAIILLLLLVAFFFLKHSIVDFANGLVEKIHSEAPAVQQPQEPEALPMPTPEPEPTPSPTPEPAIANANANADTATPRTYTEFIGTENLHADSRLAYVAYKYYGEKDCWVFLWEANKDHLTNPHKIKKGTPIRIPKLPAEWKDMSNPQTRQMVDEMIALYK